MSAGEHQEAASETAQSNGSSESPEISNLRAYRPTPYEPLSWPVVSTTSTEEAFSPSSYERVSERRYVVDPMFANFDQELKTAPERASRRNATTFIAESGEEMPVVSSEDLVVYEDASTEIIELEVAAETGILVGADTHMTSAEENDRSERGSDDVPHSGAATVSTSAANSKSSSRRGESAEFEERVEQEVQKRIAAAQEEREQMLAQVQEVAYAKACQDVKQEYSNRFETLVDDTQNQVKEMCRDYEQQAVDLAFQIAKKLLGSIVGDHREYIHEVLAEALKAAGNAEIQCIRVSPQDHEFLSASQTHDRTWKIESDDSIGAGCIVVTSTGDVDFDLEKSWARMREKVTRGPKS